MNDLGFSYIDQTYLSAMISCSLCTLMQHPWCNCVKVKMCVAATSYRCDFQTRAKEVMQPHEVLQAIMKALGEELRGEGPAAWQSKNTLPSNKNCPRAAWKEVVNPQEPARHLNNTA